LPALESSHAIAYAQRLARELGRSATILVNLSGRGDKDVHTVGEALDARPGNGLGGKGHGGAR
jgi:tryptophan synthase beta chain